MVLAVGSPLLFRLAESRLGLWKLEHPEVAAQSFRIVSTPIFLTVAVAFATQAILSGEVAWSDWCVVASASLLTSALTLAQKCPKWVIVGVNVALAFCVWDQVLGSAIVAVVGGAMAAFCIVQWSSFSNIAPSELVFDIRDTRVIRSAIIDFLRRSPKAKMHFAAAVRASHLGARRVVLTPTEVVKYSDAEATQLEVMRTQHAVQIAGGAPVFNVPKIVHSNIAGGSIAFDRLYGYEPLWGRLWRDPSSATELLERCAIALAAVHDAGIPTDWPESDVLGLPWNDGASENLLHGDFNIWNVMVDRSSNRLAIIDWATSDVCRGAAYVGPYQFDVVWFIVSLHRYRFGGRQRLENIEQLARHFINDYCTHRRVSVDRASFQRYLNRALPEVERIFRPQNRRFRQRLQRFFNFDVDITALKRLQLDDPVKTATHLKAA